MKPSIKDKILSRQESVIVDELHVVKSVGSYDVCTVNFVNDLTTEPQTLFYDSMSDRYFYSTFSKVLTAEYHANRMYCMFGTLYLDEFYGYLGIPSYDLGSNKYKVWDIELSNGLQWIEFNHEPIIHRNIHGYSISVGAMCEPMEIDATECDSLCYDSFSK